MVGIPVEANHAQFVIVDPTVAVDGIVKVISNHLHCPGPSADVLVTVTMLPTIVALRPGDTVPIAGLDNAVGTVSVTVNDEIGLLPLLQM